MVFTISLLLALSVVQWPTEGKEKVQKFFTKQYDEETGQYFVQSGMHYYDDEFEEPTAPFKGRRRMAISGWNDAAKKEMLDIHNKFR